MDAAVAGAAAWSMATVKSPQFVEKVSVYVTSAESVPSGFVAPPSLRASGASTIVQPDEPVAVVAVVVLEPSSSPPPHPAASTASTSGRASARVIALRRDGEEVGEVQQPEGAAGRTPLEHFVGLLAGELPELARREQQLADAVGLL